MWDSSLKLKGHEILIGTDPALRAPLQRGTNANFSILHENAVVKKIFYVDEIDYW